MEKFVVLYKYFQVPLLSQYSLVEFPKGEGQWSQKDPLSYFVIKTMNGI
jgi:hypothetical protein